MWNDHVSVSLICLNQVNLKQEVQRLLSFGIHNFHADFMDNTLVPRLGLAPEVIQHLKATFQDNIHIDSHLMLKDPERYLDSIAAFSDWVTIHYEAQEDPLRLVQIVKKNHSAKVAIAFNPLTPTSRWVCECPDVDGVLLMGISPGVLGTSHYENIVKSKIMELRYNNWFTKPIFIDGAVNFNSIPKYNTENLILICGSSTILKGVDIFNPQDVNDQIIGKNIKELQKCIQ